MKSEDLNQLRKQAEEKRNPDYNIEPLFYHRWSPRSIGREMTEEDLKSIFEAARWAPSSYNNQSWRFIYTSHKDEEYKNMIGLLSDFNREWAETGYALVVIASKTTFDHSGEHSKTNSFDTGAAWQNMALEATRRGIVAHGMQGFDYEKAKEILEIPEEFEVQAMVAIGSQEDEEEVPEDMRVHPSGRKDLSEIISKGKFNF